MGSHPKEHSCKICSGEEMGSGHERAVGEGCSAGMMAESMSCSARVLQLKCGTARAGFVTD